MTHIPTTAAAPSGVEDRSGVGGSRGLARAVGRQTAGVRAAAMLTGDELTASLGLLADAARRRLPLLVHLTVDDHSAYHAAASIGALTLFAADPQEALDLTLIARRTAELALVPAVVAMNVETARAAAELEPLAPETVEGYLGAAGELIHPPTPSQTMLFGKHRRRVPRWHDPERPLLVGAACDGDVSTAAAASRRAFFDVHLPALLDDAFEAFAEATGRRYEALRTHRVRRAKILLVAQGAAVTTAEAVADRLRETGGPRVGVVGIRALRPLPAEPLGELLRGGKTVVTLERLDTPAGTTAPLAAEVRSLTAVDPQARRTGSLFSRSADEQAPRLVSTLYALGGAALREPDLAALCERLGQKEELRSPIYLGLETSRSSAYPKRQAHLDAVCRDYPEVSRLGLRAAARSSEEGERSAPEAPDPPASVRRLGRSGAPLADVPGFFDRVGVLSPDPFLATGTVPPLTAALAAPPERETLPAFDPAPCTGCGDCWSACPDGALQPMVIGAGALLEEGMRLARQRGRSVDKLRMVKSKLTEKLRRALADDAHGGATAGELLDAAFEPLIAQMKLPDERAAAVRDAFSAVRDELADLPLARTEAFFEGAGNAFALAVDPDACKGCGLCVAACEPRALTALEDDALRTAGARALWRLAEELPEPEAAVRQRARSDERAGPLAAALLSREARRVMAAVPSSEPGSGEVLAARLVLGAAAAHLAPLRESHLAEVEELGSRLAAEIHESLANALPDRDLDALAEGLDALERPEADLTELTSRVEAAFDDERVDVARTRRLTAAARRLADVRWRLDTGEGGIGRSLFGLVVAGAPASWAGTFPDNPFAVPVTVAAPGRAAEIALGLIEGQLEGALEHVRALRRSRLELESARPDTSDAADPARVSWESLDAEERLLCPPLFLLTSDAALADTGVAELAAALETELPLAVIVFCDGAAPLDVGLLALTRSRALVAQTSIAHPDHLGAALAATLDHPGPAFVRVLAPSPARGAFAADATLAQATEAVATGRFQLWISTPEERGTRIEDVVRSLTSPAAGDSEPAERSSEETPQSEAVANLERRHRDEMAALAAGHEARLADLEQSVRARLARSVHARLLRLAIRGAATAVDPSELRGASQEAET